MPKSTNKTTKRHKRSLRLAQREAWLRQIAPTSLFHALFDHLPGLHFFAKNRRGETMFASSSVRKLYDLRDEADVIGLTDFDLNPPVMAKGYVADDARIYRTGEPVLRRVELWWDARGIPDWYQVTKLPIRSRRGAIIGIMGVLQRYEGGVHLAMPWREIDAAVRCIREKFRGPVNIAELAKLTDMSARQLERKFHAILGVSPQEFLIKTRVLAACHALRQSNASLADIATDCGFYDQSSFTEHFRRYVGQTPREFRRSMAGS
ncbi:MAG: helix-turn-helix domain-containing protein [Verrucomicrobia bacterium]|nr:helix-turn-helix domain-containing protein [Verrucomicrobiota bacterium]